TMEEFFHTFNALYEANKQIILSSDRPPREIDLESRLRSRFEWGLITDIQPPELETRIAILKMNADSRGVNIPEDVLVFVAEQVTSNIRELEGALLRVIASCSLKGETPTRSSAARILSEVFAQATSPSSSQPSLAQIGQLVAEHYGVRVADLRDKSRTKEVVVPRQVAMYLIRETTGCSLPEIGQYFGRDHTTVLHGIVKIRSQLAADHELAKAVATLRGLLGNHKSG
ncbi:MAG: chromosomal replication initiator protein DnaA, partial [Deinococcus sp.]|nr:chromosomal replication initiator protein DnaA [Deinococcus sp.]